MTTPASGAISFDNIRTEFGGTNNISLPGYKIASGNVANHENNSTIPTSDSNLSLNKWYGTDKDFEGTGYGDGSTTTSVIGGTTFNPIYDFTYYRGVSIANPVFGTFGQINLIGKNKTSSTQVELLGVYDQSSDNSNYDAYLLMDGSHTGSWWSSVTASGTTLNRSSAIVPNGTFGGGITYWYWSSPFGFDGVGTFNVQIVLS